MQNTIQTIMAIMQRSGIDKGDEDYIAQSDAKLTQILQKASSDDSEQSSKDCIDYINAFITANDVQRRKILSYCFDFFDPTVSQQKANTIDEQICQHAYLKQDELYMLHQFVKRHQNDISFGDTVYKIMDQHGMTAPQVYKNALLRRQDFARVTDSRCKNVTRKMVWQIVIGLHCSLEEADDVLFSAGYIRRNIRMDLTMQYFIEHKNYDIEAIDAVLSELGLKTFTCE